MSHEQGGDNTRAARCVTRRAGLGWRPHWTTGAYSHWKGKFGVEKGRRRQDLGRESLVGQGEWEGAGATMNHSYAARKMGQYKATKEWRKKWRGMIRGESVGRKERKKQENEKIRGPKHPLFLPLDSSWVLTLERATFLPACRACRLQVAPCTGCVLRHCGAPGFLATAAVCFCCYAISYNERPVLRWCLMRY